MDTRLKTLSPVGDLIGRLLLAQLFIIEAVLKLGQYSAAQTYMAHYGLPGILLGPAILVELGGGLLLIFGWQTRAVSFVLAGFCLSTALIFHTDFANRNEVLHFQKDLALAGAFLILSVRGAGAFSLDKRLKKRPDR